MFAIVDFQGSQYQISEGQKLQIAYLKDQKEGDKISFDKVLLISKDENNTLVGSPYLEGATVDTKVLNHGRGKKIRVFKMKSKKRYSVSQGHRQNYTELEILKINEKGGTKSKAKSESAVKAEKKPEEQKAAKKEEKKEEK